MERAVEEGAALDGLAVDGDRQGMVAGSGLEECADRVGRLGRLEGDRGSMRPGGAVVRGDMGRIAAEEVSGLQNQAVAWAWVPAGDAPAQCAAPARQGEKPEPGGVLRLGDAGLPVALAEGQQDGGIGDPLAVVGEGNAGDIAILLDGRGDAVPSLPTSVRHRYPEELQGGRGENSKESR